ncbi:glycogen synthase [Patescibacteria group bacterium]|nr:glycogen synthase [Patescibacteria group bacterium]MBU1868366.1 glycogen synthase [Patescibacteria group bacterium]
MPKSSSFITHVEDLLFTPPAKKGREKLKILLCSPEVAPYANVGGLSKAVGDLARALIKLGHDARVFMPKFGNIDEEKYPSTVECEGLKVPTDNKERPELICNVKLHRSPSRLLVYFLENREYYELRANVYGYTDDPIRWALLSRGCLEFFSKCSDWVPDIFHANDWETGHIPNWLRTTYDKDSKLFQSAVTFTIHNLQFHGNFDHRNVPELNSDDGRSPIADFFSDRLLWQDILRRGIMYGDVINTVSKTYSKEILRPEYGEFLDKLLTEVRSKLHGIRNGIDYEELNPATDKLLKVNYDVRSLDRRVINKLALQEEFDLEQDRDIPLMAYEGRIDSQKGVDLLTEIMQPLLKDFKVQFILMGSGDGGLMELIKQLRDDFPDKVGAHLMADFTLPRLIFAGADMMFYPSRFEPCGIVPMEGMRYGAIPIVRATGGLADTVEQFDPAANTGTGFVFQEFDGWSLFAQTVRALEIYRQKKVWQELQKRAMMQDNSWEARAEEYIGLYEKAIHFRSKQLVDEERLEAEGADFSPI